MKVVIERVRVDYRFSLEEIDIDTDAALRERYNDDIPVLCVNGQPAFRWRADEKELRARLAREFLP